MNKNIYLIPTNKPSNLFLGTKTGKLYIKPIGDIGIPQLIYITSDDEPKHLDYYITKIKDSNGERYIVGQRLDTNDSDYSNCKKIILTTDQELIQDGIQYIDDKFLEWFVKNSSCEFVEIIKKENWYQHTGSGKYWEDEPVWMKTFSNLGDYYYKIIIPQETLEEAAKNYVKNKWELAQEENEESFIAGAKWQEKRMYTKEEVEQIFNIAQRTKAYGDYKPYTFKETLELFEQEKARKKVTFL